MTLRAQGLEKRLGEHHVLGGVDLACGPGEGVVVVGENGAGKSTLLRVLGGIIEPDRGQVTLCGHRLDGGGAAARTRGRGKGGGGGDQRSALPPAPAGGGGRRGAPPEGRAPPRGGMVMRPGAGHAPRRVAERE